MILSTFWHGPIWGLGWARMGSDGVGPGWLLFGSSDPETHVAFSSQFKRRVAHFLHIILSAFLSLFVYFCLFLLFLCFVREKGALAPGRCTPPRS